LICTSCGEENKEKANYCWNCGVELNKAKAYSDKNRNDGYKNDKINFNENDFDEDGFVRPNYNISKQKQDKFNLSGTAKDSFNIFLTIIKFLGYITLIGIAIFIFEALFLDSILVGPAFTIAFIGGGIIFFTNFNQKTRKYAGIIAGIFGILTAMAESGFAGFFVFVVLPGALAYFISKN